MSRIPIAFVCLSLIASLTPAVCADEPETALVKRVPFGDRIETKGRFVPADAHQIKIEMDVYRGPLEIEELAAYGPVEEGQTLIRFARTTFARQVKRKRLELELTRVNLGLQDQALARKATSLQRAQVEAERAYRRAKDDFEFFNKADEEMRFQEREMGVQLRRDRLDNQEEELAQLVKMYSADDLTEETEEIVLKRAKRALSRSKKSMNFAERRYARWLKRTHGRDREDREWTLQKSKLKLEQVTQTSGAELSKAKLLFEKAGLDLERLEQDMTKLEADGEQLTLRAPVQGVLYPGGWHGSWKGYAEMKQALEVGERVKPGVPLMTVMSTGPLHVLTTVTEKDLLQVKQGLRVGIVPVADQSTTLRGEVTDVSPFAEEVSDGSPVGERGVFRVEIALDERDERLLPGMACEVSILTSTGTTALAVPVRAVTQRDGQTVVFVVSDSGPRQVAIVPGITQAGLVSVVKGLEAGERVLLDPPEKESTAKEPPKNGSEAVDAEGKSKSDSAGGPDKDKR